MRLLRIDGPTREATFYAREGDHLTRVLERGYYYEADLLEEIRSRQVRGDYFDVGAHIGNHTLYFAMECPAKRVLAIEANPDSYLNLCANVMANGLQGHVDCLNAAIHPEWTSAYVTPGDSDNSGMAGVGEDGPIPAVTLDDLRGEQVGLIKIDTEGGSLDVLRSARAILALDHPLIAAEAIDEAEFKGVRSFLADFGYKEISGPYAITPVFIFQ